MVGNQIIGALREGQQYIYILPVHIVRSPLIGIFGPNGTSLHKWLNQNIESVVCDRRLKNLNSENIHFA